nr:DUF1896 family protein [Bacteroides graminisolvens]
METRAGQTRETDEQALRKGYSSVGAEELAILTLFEGFYFSKYALLTEVLENEFADDVREKQIPAFAI